MTLNPAALDALQAVDSDWALIPVDGNKRPVNPATGKPADNWAATTYDLDGITALAKASPHMLAVGVVLGPVSGGLLALDLDGIAAGPTFQQVYGRSVKDLPPTVGWSSGLTKRAQLGFRVPREHWPYLRGRRRWLHDGKTSLELRWAGHQSVIAGAHPDTSGYQWLDGRSPSDLNVADAPDWLLEPLFRAPDEPIQAEYRPTAADAGRALEVLTHITVRDDYEGWLAVGMALHAVDPGLLISWVEWSKASKHFNEEECLKKWSSFKGSGRTIGTLYWLAREDGWSGPKHLDPVELLSRAESFSAGPDDEHQAAADQPQQTTKPPSQQIEELFALLLINLLDPGDTWAREHALRAELWKLGVPTSAIDERVYYALAQEWGLPLQASHSAAVTRGRRLSDPIESQAEDLVPGFLLWQRDHLLFGAGGTGKTLAAAALAVSCIKGTSFLDQEIPPSRTGKVLWIGTDAGEGARAMVREYLEDLGAADDPDVEANLTIWTAEASDNLSPWACTPAGLMELKTELESGGYVLVVIDSLKAVLELAGVNFAIGPVGTLMRLLQALVGRHCSLLWLHHPAGGKAAGKGLTAAAGSQNINQIPSAVHQITRKTDDRGQSNVWSVHKLRGSQGREFCYRLAEDGLAVSEGEITKNARVALLDSIDLRIAQGITTSTVFLHQEMPQFNESTIRNNLTWLRKRGLIKKAGKSWLLTPDGRKLLTLSQQGQDLSDLISSTPSPPTSTK